MRLRTGQKCVEMGGGKEIEPWVGRSWELKHREIKPASTLQNKHVAKPRAESEFKPLLQDHCP